MTAELLLMLPAGELPMVLPGALMLPPAVAPPLVPPAAPAVCAIAKPPKLMAMAIADAIVRREIMICLLPS